MKDKQTSAVAIILGILYFIAFAYDIEYDRDMTTWLWFLNAQLWLMISAIFLIKSFIHNENK